MHQALKFKIVDHFVQQYVPCDACANTVKTVKKGCCNPLGKVVGNMCTLDTHNNYNPRFHIRDNKFCNFSGACFEVTFKYYVKQKVVFFSVRGTMVEWASLSLDFCYLVQNLIVT